MAVDVEETYADDGVMDDTDLDEQRLMARAEFPMSEDFVREDEDGEEVVEDFLAAPALEALAEEVIRKHNLPAQYFPIVVLWKRKGGTSAGKPTLGKTQKLTGLSRHFAGDAQFCIWIAADHIERHEFTNYQLEALIFHELQHIDASVDDDGNTIPRLKSHDFEGFARDIQEYGAWMPTYRRLQNTFTQAELLPDGYVS